MKGTLAKPNTFTHFVGGRTTFDPTDNIKLDRPLIARQKQPATLVVQAKACNDGSHHYVRAVSPQEKHGETLCLLYSREFDNSPIALSPQLPLPPTPARGGRGQGESCIIKVFTSLPIPPFAGGQGGRVGVKVIELTVY